MTSSLVGSEMCIRDRCHCTSEDRGRVDCSPPGQSAIALQRIGAGLIVCRLCKGHCTSEERGRVDCLPTALSAK
eukprot:5599047-Prorocentrum_lima.AAC.1